MSIDAAIHQKLERARKELLDLTARNRLLNTPRTTARSGRLEIVDELSQQTFRRLVLDRKAMSFVPAKGPAERDGEQLAGDETALLAQPDEDEELDEAGVPLRHTDEKLQTRLNSEQLQKRLLKLYYDARTYEEEQGVGILYLALGFLKWYEADNSGRERHAPLILVPVVLDRKSAASRFRLRCTDDEIATNLSLQAKLKLDFGIDLPEVPEAEDLSPDNYYAAVARAVSSQPGWEVLPDDIVLWFFSFSKFLMLDLQLNTGNIRCTSHWLCC